MPLIHKASKKAFQHNIKAEMEAHPSPEKRKQNIAIAFSVKREAQKKKKASGGTVESGSRDMNMAEGGEVSASNERRPMPENRYNDSKETSRNSGNKRPGQDSWTDTPTEKQATANDVRGQRRPIKHPKMVPTNAFSTRLYDREGNLQESSKPGPYGSEPESWENEEGADRQGPPVRDMKDEHSTHRKPYAKGGEVEAGDKESHNINTRTRMEPADSGMQEEEREDEAHLESSASPSEDEGSSMAMSHEEEGPDREGPEVPDMEDEHSTGRKPYAGGGKIGDTEENIDPDVDGTEPATMGFSPDDSEDQPEHEAEEEHHNSITAAIMANRERLHAEVDSGAHDMDAAARHMMALGGEILEEGGDILSHGSMDSDNSDQADLSRNHDEDANEEDQASFGALRKENYNDSDLDIDNPRDAAMHGDEEESDSENKHDMISSIRRDMKRKRQF
jgi:hypothetical protein